MGPLRMHRQSRQYGHIDPRDARMAAAIDSEGVDMRRPGQVLTAIKHVGHMMQDNSERALELAKSQESITLAAKTLFIAAEHSV